MHIHTTFMANILLLFVSNICAMLTVERGLFNTDPDEERTFEQLITSRGFVLQTYSVQTEDGYILTVHRVVTRDYYSEDYSKTRKPVIVQHGLLGSSVDFFINSPFLTRYDDTSACGDNFGFCLVLTDRYDIWLPNSRGNGYSNGHVSGMTPDDRDFWSFSFDQMAVYDAPAVIEFVRQKTGHETVGYIGFSQGVNIMLGLLSLKPEYAEVVRPFIAWAPPPFISEMTSKMRYLVPLVPLLHHMGGKFIFPDDISASLSEAACGVLGILCARLISAMVGESTSLNETRLPVYNHFFTATVSNWQMVHFAQLYKTGQFARFDYGTPEANIAAYGQAYAPLYPLENIPANYNIAIVRGNTDAFVAREDAEKLIRMLRDGNVNVDDYVVPREVWSHLDNLFGMDAGELVGDKTIELLDKYTDY